MFGPVYDVASWVQLLRNFEGRHPENIHEVCDERCRCATSPPPARPPPRARPPARLPPASRPPASSCTHACTVLTPLLFVGMERCRQEILTFPPCFAPSTPRHVPCHACLARGVVTTAVSTSVGENVRAEGQNGGAEGIALMRRMFHLHKRAGHMLKAADALLAPAAAAPAQRIEDATQ